LPIYISNILIRDINILEQRRFATPPIPVFISGKKSGERVYFNDYLNISPKDLLIENSTRILYVFLKARGLEFKIIDSVPPEILSSTGVKPPKMTFNQFLKARDRVMKKAARKA